MTAKEYMIGLKDLKRLIKAKEQELKDLEEIVDGAPRSGAGAAHTSSDGTPPFVRTVERKEQLEHFINARLHALYGRWYDAEKALSRLPPMYESLLLNRYINGKTWEMIADELHYSTKQVQRFHGNALEKLKDVLKCP